METVHPCLQAAVIGVHILHMKNLLHDADACFHIHSLEQYIQFPCHSHITGVAVCAKHAVFGENRLDNLSGLFADDLLQDRVGGLSTPVPANQHRNLFIGQPQFFGPANAFARGAGTPLFLALKDSRKKVSSVSTIPFQLGGLLSLGSSTKPRR